ncbi:MAG: divergent PAP2 family protein [Anaerolineales bacterium]|nr:divergent PAP2 family protein [Anaerolineales bacterium]MCX7609338.1 divergent PAP2 family protein [Anaerolineales bacterium]MDW8227623.1 divergent PAP2 family protein [Anaerolineales bacterium]
MKALLANPVLWSGIAAWLLAQTLKIPLDYLRYRHWKWGLFFAAGGMPSSHSALITATAIAIGLHHGFDTPLFALAVAIAMIVVYDAAGVRRQAGMHAQKINVLVQELLRGHPISEQQLREVIGHTPLEAAGGVLLGIVVAHGVWLLWKP